MKKRDLFLIGASVGIALGYYANSNKGRKLRAQMAEDLNERSENIKEKGQDVLKNASGTVSELKEKGNSFISDASDLMSDLRAKGNNYLRSMGQNTIKDGDVEGFINQEIQQFKDQLLDKVQSQSEAIKEHINN